MSFFKNIVKSAFNPSTILSGGVLGPKNFMDAQAKDKAKKKADSSGQTPEMEAMLGKVYEMLAQIMPALQRMGLMDGSKMGGSNMGSWGPPPMYANNSSSYSMSQSWSSNGMSQSYSFSSSFESFV